MEPQLYPVYPAPDDKVVSMTNVSSNGPNRAQWFVARSEQVDECSAMFGPLATMEAALQVRNSIEALEGHQGLLVTRDDDHARTYDRDLTKPKAPVFTRAPAPRPAR